MAKLTKEEKKCYNCAIWENWSKEYMDRNSICHKCKDNNKFVPKDKTDDKV